MVNILVHGLGQTDKSWDMTADLLKDKGMNVRCPNLFDLKANGNYSEMYRSFADTCNQQTGKLNLCGLSLGGILVLDYAKEYPDKVHSIIIIGTPFQIPKVLFKLQSVIFKCMPKKTFEEMGCRKQDFIQLVNSMAELNIPKGLENITCNTLILCGAKDKVNMKSAKLLNEQIKHSSLDVICDAGHEVNIENPEKLADVILKFWQ